MTDQNNYGFFRIVLVRSATGNDNNGCWSGGEILGQYAPSTLWATWRNELTNVLDHGMHDKYGLLVGNNDYASGLRIDNVFIFNYGDGISFDNVTDYATNNDFTIRNVHMKYIRDDCIEDDSYLGGTIDSAFLDGCYSGVSAQSNRSATFHTITMSHSLVRLQSMDVVYKSAANGDDSSQAGPRHNWFWKWSPNAPKLKLYNNVFRVDGWQPGNENDHLVPRESMFTDPPECENNTIVWLGPGSFPENLPFPNQQPTPCFTVTTDVTVWDNAVTDWQNAHAPPSGAAKPIVSIFPARQPYYWPSPTQPYTGTMPVIATAVDDRAVSSVRFQIDGKDIGTVTQADAIGNGSTGPTKYNLSWDSRYYADGTPVANGSHMLRAIARDDQNQETTSTEVPVTVSNTAVPPPSPSNPSTTGVGTTGWTANWANGDPAAETEVWVKQGSSGTYALAYVATPGATNQAVGGKLDHTEYFWKVRHRKNGLMSPYTADQSVKTKIGSPTIGLYRCVMQGVAVVRAVTQAQGTTTLTIEESQAGSPSGWTVILTVPGQVAGNERLTDNRSVTGARFYRAKSGDPSWPTPNSTYNQSGPYVC